MRKRTPEEEFTDKVSGFLTASGYHYPTGSLNGNIWIVRDLLFRKTLHITKDLITVYQKKYEEIANEVSKQFDIKIERRYK